MPYLICNQYAHILTVFYVHIFSHCISILTVLRFIHTTAIKQKLCILIRSISNLLPTSPPIRTDECCSTPERCLRCLDSTRGGTRKLGIANDTKTAAKVKRSHGPLDRNAIVEDFFGQTAVLPWAFLRS